MEEENMDHMSWEIGKTGKILILFIILSLPFSSLTFINHAEAESHLTSSYTISFEDPIFSTITINNLRFVKPSIASCIQTNEPGAAELPVYTTRILIPPSCQLEQITITETHCKDYSDYISTYPLIPAQKETPLSHPESPVFQQNQSWYNQSNYQPKEPYTSAGTSLINGYLIETIHLYPLRYKPLNQQLKFHGKITIEVTFIYDDTKTYHHNQFLRINQDDKQRVKDLIINSEMIDTYFSEPENQLNGGRFSLTRSDKDTPLLDELYPGGLCLPTETIEYVIITSNDLSETTGYSYNWSDLINHRQQHDGLNGCIVTIEDIDDCNDYYNETLLFNDSAAHLREFCKDAYLDWNTQYILLGGDWQTNTESRQIIPCRIMTDRDESGSYNTMPSDLYFSNLDGDWYYEPDNIWGGGAYAANDKLSELAVGRIPVWNAEMISNAVHKIIWYDSCSNESFLQSAGFLGGNLGWTSTSKQYMEEIRIGNGSFSEYDGFEEWNTAFPQYDLNTAGRYYEADYQTESDAVNAWKNAINNNELCLISHLDHGFWSNTLSLGDGSGLTNSHYFIGTSQACLSGRYTSGLSGATSFLSNWENRGAFAMVLNTGYGYGSRYSTAGKSQLQHKIWWDYFFKNQTTTFDNWRLGPAMQYTKDTFSAYIDSLSHVYSYVWYSWNLFGDPAQQIRINTEENNQPNIHSALPANNETNVNINLSQLSIVISDQDNDSLNWSIETSPNIGRAHGTHEDNGTKICSISNLTCNTTYTWFINVSDGIDMVNCSMVFTTQTIPPPHVPTGFQAVQFNRTCILLNWTKNNSADTTRIERNSIPCWDRGEGTLISNSSEYSKEDQSLLPGRTYYYQAWSWNETTNIHSTNYSVTSNSTLRNSPVNYSTPSPLNNSDNCPLTLNWSINITDADGDFLNWNISLNRSFFNSSTHDTNGTKTLIISNLTYNTTYTVWVNTTDGFNFTAHWFHFITMIPPDTKPPMISNISILQSDPMDTTLLYGWCNISSFITDTTPVSFVSANITSPDNTTQQISLSQKTDSIIWYVNTTLNEIGNYSMILETEDEYGNTNVSSQKNFFLAPNWDVNIDGKCNLLDLHSISAVYGENGKNGWIREDVDNNGKITVLDLALISEQYEQEWWE